ncbi:phosphatidate cytidylyltransferase [Phenylobacterium kunshanense]|uniref:Phosphatidate cytidylyltransferase n=1 Tax=Phenylobacterium kunshanense TaxID=1445034 RepID=A0A328BPD0_9CAUL|nr:phosphatidate cytidylyltransferase [Phenylobacterium kunshanense]RAK68953.1 phosphatidate cytidylyltransferase [Phenylobacterium kunshanense]
MTSSPPVKRFDWSNLGLRVASAAVIGPAALAAAWFGGWPYLVLIAIGVALLAIEWGGMTAPVAPTRVAAVVAAAVLISVFIGYRGDYGWAWGAIGLTAAGAAVVARGVAERPTDAAFGVLYIAPAALCLVWLRQTDQGAWWMMMLFAATWAADIGAFAVGSTLKGPKLWPRFSPNKTWSGFVGGLAAATAVGAIMASLPAFRLNLLAAAFIGFAVGLATMAGDLWESAIKRRFGVKDSGDLIPGHGGLLDRVDGLMFAVVVMAAARLANQWGWH